MQFQVVFFFFWGGGGVASFSGGLISCLSTASAVLQLQLGLMLTVVALFQSHADQNQSHSLKIASPTGVSREC